MKLEINVSYGRTINLGNYESTRIQASITEVIEDKDKRSYEEIFADLFDECEAFVLEKCNTEITKPDKKSSKNDSQSTVDESDIPF